MTEHISLESNDWISPYWIMILAICVLVDVSKYLDILTSEFSAILEHLPFLAGCMLILRLLLPLRTLESGYDIHDFCCCHLRWKWKRNLTEVTSHDETGSALQKKNCPWRLTKGGRARGPDGTCRDHWWSQLGEKCISHASSLCWEPR